MNGGQDLGGMMGFGPIDPETGEPVFHAEWERRVFALTLAAGAPGGWNIDMSRFARENRPPQDYLSKSYYELWLAGLETLLAERGLVSAQEIEEGRPIGPSEPPARILAAADVEAAMRRGGPADREPSRPASYKPGDRVMTINSHPRGHTRLPRYVRGKPGIVDAVHGCHVFPDSNAAGLGEDPQWLYGVLFDAADLWGPDAEPGQTLRVDLWEPYLVAI